MPEKSKDTAQQQTADADTANSGEMKAEDVNIYWWAGMQCKSWAQIVSGEESEGGASSSQRTPRLFTAKEKVLKKLYDLKFNRAKKEGTEDRIAPPPTIKPKDFEKVTFDSFIGLTEQLFLLKEELDSASKTRQGGGKVSTEKKMVEIMEDHLTNLAMVVYDAIGEVGGLSNALKGTKEELEDTKQQLGAVRKDVDKIKGVLDLGEARGSIGKPFEDTPVYKEVTDQVARCDKDVKITNFDVGEEITAAQGGDVVKKVREKLEKENNGVDIKGLKVTLLKKTTKVTNGKHTLPILIHTESRKKRIDMEFAIKNAKKLSTSYHWPKNTSDQVKDIREQVSKYKSTTLDSEGNPTLDMEGKHLRIRPTENGSHLQIHYRLGFKKPWILLDTVRTPAPKHVLSKAKAEQPCTSEYFKLQ